MGSADTSRSINFALIGHAGDGKTTLADSLLVAAGVINRLGRVDDGTSFMNWLPEEKHRRASISTSICSFRWDEAEFTMLDAPGDANFAGEMRGAIAASDNAVLVLNAQDGVRVGTERAYHYAREHGLGLAAVANKMDLERADYDACAKQLEEAFAVRVVKLHLPIGRGEGFRGFVNLLTGLAHHLDASGKLVTDEPPAELAAEIAAARLAMVEAVAEADDALLEKYLEEGQISEEEIFTTLRKGVADDSLLPLLCSASARNIGGMALLIAADRIFPTAREATPRKGRSGESEVVLAADPAAPVAALVWKSVADRYAGMLSILRVYSGTLRKDATLLNPRTGARERVGKLLRLHGEQTEEVTEVLPGQIAAIPKLKDTHTGDTLCEERHPLRIDSDPPPHGIISFAVAAENKGEEDKVFEALHRMVEEDHSLSLARDERTGEFLLTGLGQLHIEVTLEKIARLFHVKVGLKPPKIPYLETLKGRAENVEGKLKKQSGGRGQFGVCNLSVEPGERGTGVVFLDEIVGGSIPRQYIPAVEKGVRETCERGVIAGYPLTDVRVAVTDGKFHTVDSSEYAFKTAGSLALRAAVALAKPVLLEPIMTLSVVVPDSFVGDVMGNLSSRRGRVLGVEARGHAEIVKAHVPMAEVLTYASDLTSMTGGQGSFDMEFSHYEETPAAIQDRIVAEAAKVRHAEE
ncbi:MAG: elongation factor G [Deltaproteobacteria bacterium]|nr:elongation factor G [Deltaproteobacteria bacterium]